MKFISSLRGWLPEDLLTGIPRLRSVEEAGRAGLQPENALAYEVDPLECVNCGSNMRIIALIKRSALFLFW